MFRRFSVNFALFSILIDFGTVILGLWLGSCLRPYFSPLAVVQDLESPSYIPWFLFPIFGFIWIGIFHILAVYDGSRHLKPTDEYGSLILGSLIASVSMAGVLYFSYRDISRLQFILFVLSTFFQMLTWRGIVRLISLHPRNGSAPERRILIIGAGSIGRELAIQIKKFRFATLRIVGFVDDDPQKQGQSPDVLGPVPNARHIIQLNSVDDVVIALPQSAYQLINDLVIELHNLPVKVWVIPDYFQRALHKAKIEEFAGIPMLDLRAPALSDYQRLIKRAFDLTMIILFMPIIVVLSSLIALAIRLEDRGPILFRQNRVGENGQIFVMLKFRTMVPEAENMRHLVEHIDEAGRLIHKSLDDPRVTRIGRILRRTSLDELPQFINILRGEMSLVGPRPELPYLVDRYEPWQRKRFAVPQGVTGWWQINGRSEHPMHLHTEDDLYYVQNYSLFLDLSILAKTVIAVIRGRGAF